MRALTAVAALLVFIFTGLALYLALFYAAHWVVTR